jgi:hypothetical protein
MRRMDDGTLSRIAAGDGWRLLRNLLGGLVILAIWLSLWAWVALGVMRPLSRVPSLVHLAAITSQRA